MSSILGNNIKVSIFGQSHSAGIGVVIDGLPAGEYIDMEKLQQFMERRAPGRNDNSTKRNEPDKVEILSGIVNEKTCGAPFMALIRNTDTRSKDYSNIVDLPRPSHADYTANIKYKGFNDVAGGGHFSGRLTAPLCVAGGIAKQILERMNISVNTHISRLHGIDDNRNFSRNEIEAVSCKRFPVIDDEAGMKMQDEIRKAAAMSDSVGGIVECVIFGMPAGVGDPMFDGIENRISAGIFGIPAVRGIEFGNGFNSAELYGSENNDAFIITDNGIETGTNNHGGILGGISSGMPIVFRTAIKPTPSIGKEQNTISMSKCCPEKLIIKGRHDPCIVQRAVPCVEAVAAIVVLDMILSKGR